MRTYVGYVRGQKENQKFLPDYKSIIKGGNPKFFDTENNNNKKKNVISLKDYMKKLRDHATTRLNYLKDLDTEAELGTRNYEILINKS